MLVFLISALRAIIEMLGMCLLGQGMLYVLAGRGRANNPIYQLFDLITRPPRKIVEFLLPGASGRTISVAYFAILLLLWLGLAFVRKFI
ncbi:hypothetical protein LZ012_13275 [Dechloromonas sp. XY25]|uniref:YggT family protein n=1 Tax=Dechloromonas hankyongensis TaxID=2908002 RepID=A0ABS9K478_9RHOO|nr:hypothetical protein [Dechloromonas hankyongensis]MCG2577961.1 hypothetical protein [Dechloromonas hankyongensis]